MKSFFDFVKSTMIGGLLVLLPLTLLIVIVVKAVNVVREIVEPLLAMFPHRSVGGISVALLVAITVLLVASFVTGLLAQMTLTRRVVETIESLILSKMPGYSLMKNVGESLVGVEGKDARKTVLVQVDFSWQLGFLMDELPDGRQVVFVPDVPNAMTGTLHLLQKDRIEAVELSTRAALDSLSRLGVSLSKHWPHGDGT